MSAPALEVERLGYDYGSRAAFRDVSFAVRKGEVFGLLGPNGAGKTTLFKVLCTLLPPAHGRARILGQDVAEQPHAVRRGIGVVFQSPSLDRKLTVAENLTHQGHLYGLSGQELAGRIRGLLERFGLAGRAGERMEKLSGGLARRLELAKGLLHRPGLLLLDEPSTGLDPGARRDFWHYLEELKSEDRVAVVLTTHILEEAEGCDRLGILHEGELVALGSPAELKEKIAGDVIQLHTRNPQKLRGQIQKRFGGKPIVVDGAVRIERPQGHRLISQLVEAFPVEIESVSLGKPTLEDVFIHQTGRRFFAPPSAGS